MNSKDIKRLNELLDELIKIFSLPSPESSIEILCDIKKELYEIKNRK